MYKVSKELYNLIQNADDLQTLKNSVEEEVFSYLNHNKNYIKIRILSSNEFDKYICNDTLDGSISIKDSKVWNINYHGKSYLANIARTNFAPDESYLYNDNQQFFYVKSINYSYYQSWAATVIFSDNIYYEYANNNTANKCTCKRNYSEWCMVWIGYYPDRTRRIDTRRLVMESNILVDKNNSSIVTSQEQFRNFHGTIEGYNLYRHHCFRPAFRFIDNNKSKNIYY